MARNVVTAAANVAVPYQPTGTSGLNSRTIVASGTVLVLNDAEYAALSPTAFSSGTLLDGGDPVASGFVGTKVARAAAVLPQTATVDMFSISGGRVKIVNIIATITTVVQTQATTLKLVFTPTGGSVGDITAATTDWTAAAVGNQFYAKLAAITDVLTKSTTTVDLSTLSGQLPSMILGTGKISATTVASSTGAAKWDLWYVPIDAGALVTVL